VNSFFFLLFFFYIHRSGVLTALAWLVPQETAANWARSVYTIQPDTMSLHARPHTASVRFWQNDRDLLRATAVTRAWNGHRNKSQHRKLTLEKEIIPPVQQRFVITSSSKDQKETASA